MRPLLVLIVVALSMGRAYAQFEVFASFENQEEFSSIRASAGVRAVVSKRFPAWNANSLEATFPQNGGTLEFTKIPQDWRRKESLLLFAWSMQAAELKLHLRDASGGRFVQSFPLRSGVNHLQLRLSRARGVDLRRMQSLIVESMRGGIIYLDYFALDRFHPVIEERGRWDIDYSMSVVTPHTAWAKPFAGGRIRAFAIADVADGRGIIELAQRLDLDFKATTIGRSPGTNKWGFGDFYEQRSFGGEFWEAAYSLAHTYIADDLLNGPDYDVILWPGLHPWEDYPAEVRDEIRRRVEAGAGLVLFYPNSKENDLWRISPLIKSGAIERGKDADRKELDRTQWRAKTRHFITRGVPFDAFPWGHLSVPRSEAAGEVLLETSGGAPVLAVGTLGKGRVVAFGYSERGMIPEVEEMFETGLHYPYHEYLWSLVARAVVWAAKREPQAGIEGLQSSGKTLVVALKNPPDGVEVSATVRSGFGEVEAKLRSPVAPRANKATLEISKPLSGGQHFAEVQMIVNGRVIDWAAQSFEVPSRATIREVALESDRVKLGGQVNARLRLRSEPATGCVVTARLFDNYDRLLDERRYPMANPGETEQRISLNSTGALTHLAKVDCEVAIDGIRQDRRMAEVFILQPRRWDDYDIVMYHFDKEPIPGVWQAIDEQMRRLNVTTLSAYTLSHSKHANYNIQAQTRISGQESPDGAKRDYYSKMKKRYAETRDKRLLVREYCLHDPSYRDLIRKELKQLVEPWVRFSPLSYYVYEEPSLTCYVDDLDLCFSSHTMKAMREWLKTEYGSLDALNRKWGSNFRDWDDVTPDDAYEAQRRGNYASWADHRTFMEKSYAETFGFVLGELRKMDEEGILLNSGTQESAPHNGCDYSRINQFTKHLNAYDGGNQFDFHRNFNPEVKISGGAGYGMLGKSVFYDFYRNLFKGANGGAYIFWQFSTLDADLTLSRSGRDIADGFRELRGEGVGKLIGLSAPENNRIAIHYSYPSIHGSWIVDGTIEDRVVYDSTSVTHRRFNANRDGWVKILRDCGLQFDFIAYSDIEKGELIAKGYRTLILPMSIALSDKEVAAIRDFTRRGGVVIADALPGVMDEHCAFRDERAPADVFGVVPTRSNRDAIVAMNGEPEVKLAGSRAMLNEDGRPLLIENRFGEGKAYLLNYFLDRYPEDKMERRQGPALEKMKRALSAAGISPSVKLTSTAGDRIAGCEAYIFNFGSTRLLGLIPDKDKPEPQKARIEFDRKGAFYDVRQKRYLGSGAIFEVEIEPGAPRLFALVENRIIGMELQSPAQARLGEAATVKLGVGSTSQLRSVATFRVTDPAGREMRYYGGNEEINGGTAGFSFRTALNDAPGVWRVAVTEALSGETAYTEMTIK